MKSLDLKLLIHHHDIAFINNTGEIWLSAGIAHWVTALSDHFKEIGLLLHTSSQRMPRQDTPIRRANVKLHSLGPPGHYWDRIPRMRRIRHVCQQAGTQADGLLIRGLTPRQYTVWKHTPVSRKAFLLVRSPKQHRVTHLKPIEILSAIMNRLRENEFVRIAKNNALLMANSPMHLSEIEKLSGKKVYFVPTNTIREAEFSPFHIRPVSVPNKILFIGRLVLMKGLRELFKAISILKQQGQHCELHLVGPKIEPVYSQLQELANQLKITDHIHWHGFVPFGPELHNFYLSADVFVLPTYSEGFPRVIWEAAAHCCPVITTSVGGIPAILQHEKHAILIPPKDAKSIADAINRILSDEFLRHHLVKNAYQLAKGFTVTACAKKMVDTLSTEWI